MKRVSTCISEAQRIAALQSYQVLDTPRDDALDDIVDTIRTLLHVPIAFIGFVDSDRQWFKAQRGIDISETVREVAFCSHTIMSTDPLVIQDTTLDERFCRNPFVVGEPQIRFYLGVPIVAPGGEVIGTVCALDTVARQAKNSEVKVMRFFARQALWLMELHRYRLEATKASDETHVWQMAS